MSSKAEAPANSERTDMTHTKDEALESLILKAGINPVMQGSCYVMHPEALQAVIDEAIKQALEQPVQEPVACQYGNGGYACCEGGPCKADEQNNAAPVQEPLFWYRPCRDGMYEGPVHNNSVGGKMLRDEKPDEWKPLYTTPPAAPEKGQP